MDCEHGWPHCGRPGRFYASGFRCDEHSPWNLADLADPSVGRYCAPGPGRCYCGTCPNWVPRGTGITPAAGTALDTAAVRSGKRRSGPRKARAAGSPGLTVLPGGLSTGD